MKKYFLFFTFLLLSNVCLIAQGVAINESSIVPHSTSVLDVSSEDKGILIPRLTTIQRDAVSGAAQSLLIYNTTTKCFEFWESGSWHELGCAVASCVPSTAPTGISATNPICSGQTTQLIATGGTEGSGCTYQWGTGGVVGSNVIPGATNSWYDTPSLITSTTYWVRRIGNAPCSNTTSGVTILISVETAPSTPTAGTHVPAEFSVIWNWNSVSGATGYKYNTVNNYATATDIGASVSYTQTGLACETACTIYVWAYNDCGYSAPLTLTESTTACVPPCQNFENLNACTWNSSTEFMDTRDGKVYKQTQIGTQCWMAQNLSYNSGSVYAWQGCYNDSCSVYESCLGRLYKWDEAMQNSTTLKAQGVCPSGWHIPDDGEFKTLELYLGMTVAEVDAWDWRGTKAGELKETGWINWIYDAGMNVSNLYGFTVIGHGYKNSFAFMFGNYKNSGSFWTSEQYVPVNGNVYRRNFGYTNQANGIQRNVENPEAGHAVRCLKN